MTEEKKKEIGERLRNYAEDNYKSLADFTRIYGKSSTFFTPYFNGTSAPGADILTRLREMGCDINWLLTGVKNNIIKEPTINYGDLESRIERLEKQNDRLEKQNEQILMLNEQLFNQNKKLTEENQQMLNSIETLSHQLDKNHPVALALTKLLNMHKSG